MTESTLEFVLYYKCNDILTGILGWAVDEGSGGEPEGELFSPSPIIPNFDIVDVGFSPAFVDVDHELETPNGIEGPIPVYVEAPSLTTASTNKNLSDDSPTLTSSSITEVCFFSLFYALKN